MKGARLVFPVFILSLFAACAVGPDYRRPEMETGSRWAGPTPIDAVEPDLAQWWRSFEDSTLNRLVEKAVSQNLDIRQAAARVKEARALRAVAAGGFYPSVDATGSVTRRRQSENGTLPIGRIPDLERDQTIYDAGFDALWEIDLFGRTQRAVEAADARLNETAELRRDTVLSVVAEVARSYVALRGAQNELTALEKAVGNARQTVDLVRRQFDAGEVAAAQIAQADAELKALEAELPALEAEVRTNALAIGVLLGDLPETELALIDVLPPYFDLAPLPVGARADLLRRRPDVRAAERRLAAATADIGVATAELFPRLSISAAGGFQSLSTGDLFTASSQTWSIAPLISWRIFEGGRIRAQIRANEALAEQAAVGYEKAVLEALSDAERALMRYHLGLDSVERQVLAVAAAQRNHEFAKTRYRAGDANLLELLDAERTLRDAEAAYARTHTRAATDLVSLFKALGGGWQVSEAEES